MRATAWPPLKADWLSEQDLHAQSVWFHDVRLGVRCEFCEWSMLSWPINSNESQLIKDEGLSSVTSSAKFQGQGSPKYCEQIINLSCQYIDLYFK